MFTDIIINFAKFCRKLNKNFFINSSKVYLKPPNYLLEFLQFSLKICSKFTLFLSVKVLNISSNFFFKFLQFLIKIYSHDNFFQNIINIYVNFSINFNNNVLQNFHKISSNIPQLKFFFQNSSMFFRIFF